MKAYIVTSGIVFGLVLVAHIWRVAEEGAAVAADPFFLLSSLVSAGLCVWAWRLSRVASRA